VKNQYQQWQHQFLLERLRLGLNIGIISLSTFMVPKLFDSSITTTAQIIIFQIISLSVCFLLINTGIGRRYPSIIFLCFSTIITLPPHYEVFQHETAQIDFISPTLMFLGQATLFPLHWQLHLLSQLIVVLHFFLLLYWFNIPIEPIYSMGIITLLIYFFWFSVICNLSVYLHERLQYAEFKARLELQAEHERLLAEQEKSERLLLNILPASIAQRLKQQNSTIAENFSQVTVLFADIVGFTQLSTRLSAAQLVNLLNQIFSAFDQLVEKQQVEKIKTIGDAYMVVAGLPLPHSQHAAQIANLALEMQAIISQFNQHYDTQLKIRIGIHTGPVVAGVIGRKKFAYDLWGDTVNIASRMESHGLAGKIQVSTNVYQLLRKNYQLVERGVISIKGKGEMLTYWLISKNSVNSFN